MKTVLNGKWIEVKDLPKGCFYCQHCGTQVAHNIEHGCQEILLRMIASLQETIKNQKD